MTDDVDDFLAHFGVKGMHWGVRKATAKPLLGLHQNKSMTVKLKNGSSLHISANPSPVLARIIAHVSPGAKENIKNGALYTLKDSSGKRVGDLQLYKESPTSLNVIWVGVKKSERGKGYASAAMDGAIQFAKHNKLKTVTLEVPGNSPDARHIYEKKGFKVVHEADKTDQEDVWGGLTSMQLDLK